MKKKGYSVEVTKPTGDFGIDVEAKKDKKFIGIQVKHWKKSSNVRFEDVAKTLGVAQKFEKVIIVSTKSGFTPQSWKYAQMYQDKIEL